MLKPGGLYYYRDSKGGSAEKGFIAYQDLNVCSVFSYKKAPTRFCFALRHKNFKPQPLFAGRSAIPAAVQAEATVRIFCADSATERDSWMAALIRAKVR